ncbi:HAMP domain-containing histidine kinase [Marivibrio halodurans]|uniref:histidine kinase n=2 Tax=Marivibrio halodurans TaxID=2039722 RepID=A0A8J7S729_9PROT|nr:HAMP domain-containing histidine kinase [Marivibrio halodurans]
MLAEVLIFLPSVARFRVSWLNERLGAAHLAILTLEAAPDAMVSQALERQLLDFVGVRAIALRRAGERLALLNDMPPAVDATYDLATEGPVDMIVNALSLMGRHGEAMTRILGPSPKEPASEIEIVLRERALRDAILGFAGRILGLSLVISIITAGLVFLVLRWQFVRPMRRLTRNMIRFREAPEEAGRIVRASARDDELGVAERELATMQKALHDTLAQRRKLAALGTAVAKIQHDLRGILSTALVVSDRLESSDDPEVQRVTPTLVASIERAAKLCSQTLDYVGRGMPERDPVPVDLRVLVEEAGVGFARAAHLDNRVPEGLTAHADRDQLFRIVNNLLRNAAEAGAETVTVGAPEAGRRDRIALDFLDDGPGLPPRALEKLFQPFEGSARAGGAGLGLAIARELARGNGGDLALSGTGAAGTRFRLTLPRTPAQSPGT